MDKWGIRTRVIMRFSLLCVAAALVIAGSLQHKWFSQSAANEIEQLYRSITFSVLRTANQEFKSFRQLSLDPAIQGEIPSQEALERTLESVYETYGPNGNTPGLITFSGFVVPGSEGAIIGYTGKEGGWALSDQTAPQDSLFRLTNRPMDSSFRMEVAAASIPPNAPLLLFRQTKEPGWILVFGIDIPTFFETRIAPAMEEAFPEYTISWRAGNSANQFPPGMDPGQGFFWESKYQFSPLATLFGGKENGNLKISIPIRELFPPEPMHETEPTGPEPFPPGQAPNNGHGPEGIRLLGYIDIVPKEGSLTGPVERRLALSWMTGMVLLIVVGLGYLFTIIQIERLRSLRNREREFIASVTHELRTPLTVIRSAAENMEHGIISEDKIPSYGGLIREQASRLGGMVEEVLLFSRLATKSAIPRELKETNLVLLMDNLRNTMESIAKTEGIRLQWDMDAIPDRVITDPEALSMILENMITNAMFHAYPDKTGGTVRIGARLRLPHTLVFTVEDDGTGISGREARRIFEPFYRSKNSRENQEKGSGLGLYIARKKGELIEGNLALTSPYERPDGIIRPGCRFTLTIPYHSPAIKSGNEETI